MQKANVMVALGGDSGNTVPKYGITAGEVAVLRAIHGNDSVFDIEVLEGEALDESKQPVKNRQELARLKQVYGNAKDHNNNVIVEQLYPGAAARVFEAFDELELPDEFYKADRRMNAAPAAVKEAAPAPAAPVAAEAPAKPVENTLTAKELTALLVANKVEIPKGATKSVLVALVEKMTADKEAANQAAADEADEDDGIGDMPAVGSVLE